MTPFQTFSIATSTITIIFSLLTFVLRRRRQHFISPEHPVIASLFPLSLFLITGIAASTIQFSFTFGYDITDFVTDDKKYSVCDSYLSLPDFDRKKTLLFFFNKGMWVCNLVNLVLTVVILVHPPSIRWRRCCSFIHFIIGCCAVAFLFFGRIYSPFEFQKHYESFHTCRLTLVCSLLHLILGVMILPAKDFAPRIFAPVFGVLFQIIGVVLRGGLTCCPGKIGLFANKILNGITSVHKGDDISAQGMEKGNRECEREI